MCLYFYFKITQLGLVASSTPPVQSQRTLTGEQPWIGQSSFGSSVAIYIYLLSLVWICETATLSATSKISQLEKISI